MRNQIAHDSQQGCIQCEKYSIGFGPFVSIISAAHMRSFKRPVLVLWLRTFAHHTFVHRPQNDNKEYLMLCRVRVRLRVPYECPGERGEAAATTRLAPQIKARSHGLSVQ